MPNDVFKVILAIKNSIIANRASITVNINSTRPRILLSLLRILYEEGYILSYYYSVELKKVIIINSYYQNIPTISVMKIFNKTSFPVYVKYTDLPAMHRFGIELLILSTTAGIMPHYKAIKHRLGGQVLCYIR